MKETVEDQLEKIAHEISYTAENARRQFFTGARQFSQRKFEVAIEFIESGQRYLDQACFLRKKLGLIEGRKGDELRTLLEISAMWDLDSALACSVMSQYMIATIQRRDTVDQLLDERQKFSQVVQ
ncbi:hypothetical protein [Enterococcus songbeiensis]|uniref:hypothetical protein n=1 Tax=Enterococcus songbeiensis TaxID=2559927 RepID=UPI0010F910E2|nr:hypothetical protein [Enterococcus songbeiensis]